MDSEEKYEYWLDVAVYDLECAEVMLKSGRYLYVAFMCQQAVEKLAKGLFILFRGEEPPRIHNIWKLFDRIFDDDQRSNIGTPEELEKYYSVFDELLAYYISGRYPSYKDKLSQSITADKASEVLDRTKEVFSWLKSLEKFAE